MTLSLLERLRDGDYTLRLRLEPPIEWAIMAQRSLKQGLPVLVE
ncbi:hypothetical protein N9B57_03670 [Verrucomicrobia bacterium]|nr:hypothetical protein [Verrucomicrobiota bacterium]MDB4746263.1 hypothetical protein [Verrucomicrobiota bacterium]